MIFLIKYFIYRLNIILCSFEQELESKKRENKQTSANKNTLEVRLVLCLFFVKITYIRGIFRFLPKRYDRVFL